MRRLAKFLHTAAAIGFAGSLACLMVLSSTLPPASFVSDYATARTAMATIGDWVYLPSLVLVLVSGLLSMGLSPVFMNARWALLKLVSGILVFEAGLIGVHGPLRREAELSQTVLAGNANATELAQSLGSEFWSMAVLMAIAVLNVGLGVWRPALRSKHETA